MSILFGRRGSEMSIAFWSPEKQNVNGFGLSDMSENVWEWVWDWYEKYDFSSYWKVSDLKKRLRERNKQIEIAKRKGIYNPYIKYTTSNFL